MFGARQVARAISDAVESLAGPAPMAVARTESLGRVGTGFGRV